MGVMAVVDDLEDEHVAADNWTEMASCHYEMLDIR